MANLKYVRAAELKHGRVAMLGFLGWVVTQFVHLPGEIYAESNPLKAIAAVPLISHVQIFLFIAAIELATLDRTYTADKPWDLGFDPMNMSKVRSRDGGEGEAPQRDNKKREVGGSCLGEAWKAEEMEAGWSGKRRGDGLGPIPGSVDPLGSLAPRPALTQPPLVPVPLTYQGKSEQQMKEDRKSVVRREMTAWVLSSLRKK